MSIPRLMISGNELTDGEIYAIKEFAHRIEENRKSGVSETRQPILVQINFSNSKTIIHDPSRG